LFTLLLLGATGVDGDAEDPFSTIWESTWRQIHRPRELLIDGELPFWLSGTLLKNAGGAYESDKRNLSAAFDGIPKIFKFNISGGRVFYQERFLQTKYYQYIQEHNDIPRCPLMLPPKPEFSPFALPVPTAGDLTNVQVWGLRGDDRILALTDSTMVNTFDIETLEMYGALPTADDAAAGMIELSASHPQIDPSADEPDSVLLNFVAVLLGAGTSVGRHEIVVYRMGADKVRRPFGSAFVSFAPYIHSFSVTKTKMILMVNPLGFDNMCVIQFKGLIPCMQCPDGREATILVFDLNSTEKSAKPIATIVVSSQMVMHHINGFDDEETGDIVFHVSTHDVCAQLFTGATGNHAVLDVMRDPVARDKVIQWGKFRTFRINMNRGSQPSVSHADTILRDANGFVYQIDFPYVNPRFAAKRNRFVWGITSYAGNSSHYADWAVLKIDLDAREINTKAWYRENHFPAEPVFVPQPKGAEDEGVLLVPVTDGVEKRGYLLVLNATTMEELAIASLSPGEHLPYTQHGKWFESDLPRPTMIVV